MNKIGFIGMGNMAQAIAQGFIKSQKIESKKLYAFAPNQDKLNLNAKKIGFNPCKSLTELVDSADTIIFACKPYQIKDVLSQIKDKLKDKNIISIAAGWVLSTFQAELSDKHHIQCIMPNTPAMVGEGVLLFEKENTLDESENKIIKDLFSSLGLVKEIPSSLMGIGGAISGCGPAFMDLMMEAYADAAVKYGISRDLAYSLVAQTMKGSAVLQLETKSHPGVLKDAVCSPNGTTIRGVDSLEKNGFRGACISSIDAIMDYKKLTK